MHQTVARRGVLTKLLRKQIMLTRREILNELRRIGITEQSSVKEYLEDFEHYMEISHGLKITPTRAESEKKLFKKNSASVK